MDIYWTGTWGTISDTSWNNSDAEVVCRQLGHSTNGICGIKYLFHFFIECLLFVFLQVLLVVAVVTMERAVEQYTFGK